MKKALANSNQNKSKQYEYTALNKCNIGDHVYCYGVILDASFPHKSFKSDKYVCSLKIADNSLKIDPKDGTVDYVTVVFFGKSFDDLPISQRIGDIIRIHRANVTTYKGQKQLIANVCYNASWALFAPSYTQVKKGAQKDNQVDEFKPFAFFGNKFQQEKNEQKLVRDLRKWTADSFAKYPVLGNRFITSLCNVPEVGAEKEDGKFYDFDLQVKVVQLFKLDAYSSEARVIDDSGEIWHFQLLNLKYRWLREGHYVRIRAATLANHVKYTKTFGLRHYSNIMSLPFPCALAQNMLFDEISAVQAFEQEQLKTTGILMHPIVVSTTDQEKNHVMGQTNQKSLVSIENLLEEETKSSDNEEDSKKQDLEEKHQIHRVRLSFEGVAQDMNDLQSCIKIVNKKTHEVREIGGKKAESALKANEEYTLFLQIFAKDYSNKTTNQMLRVIIIDSDNKNPQNNFFRGVQPQDILKNKKNAIAQVNDAMKTLTRFNVWVEANVRTTPEGYLVIQNSTHLKSY